MKTVTGRIISAEPISLSNAATLLSRFSSSENGANQAVSAYLRRASAAFTELKSIHREIKSSSGRYTKTSSDELGRAKGIADLVGNGGKIRFRKTETVSEEESIHGLEQDEIKEDKKKKKKKKKKYIKKNKSEDVVDGKVKENLEDEQRNEERKEKKKKKNKKKMKSDGEMGSEERESKKKRKSKEIDG